MAQFRLDWHTINQFDNTPLQEILESHQELFRDELGTLRGYKVKIFVDANVKSRYCKARTVQNSYNAILYAFIGGEGAGLSDIGGNPGTSAVCQFGSPHCSSAQKWTKHTQEWKICLPSWQEAKCSQVGYEPSIHAAAIGGRVRAVCCDQHSLRAF